MKAIPAVLAALALAFAASVASAAGTTSAVVHKPSADVHGAADLKSPTVATLKRNASVDVTGQQGLWFKVALPAGQAGFMRVNDVRMASAAKGPPASTLGALFGGKAGSGRTTETAGVRGLDESTLKAAGFDGAQLAKMESYRATPDAAAAFARNQHWAAAKVAYPDELQPGARGGATQAEKRGGLAVARGLLGGLLGGVGSDAVEMADASMGKSEDEMAAEELELGPQIAGRILGAAPLWDDPDAQRRVNLIGRWMASQTSRPDLPWTFGVIDSGEVNAFAAPGGYVLVTRGLYQLLADDAEVAAVLGHEIGHVVQRDHYNVIRKQMMSGTGIDIAASHVNVGGGLAGSLVKDYMREHGAAVMATSLDRGAEYHADHASAIYLARSGSSPLALYGVLQKMSAVGTKSPEVAQLYRTHPPLDQRMDRLDRDPIAMKQ